MKKIISACKKLVQTNASPDSIALGFATGTFIAILPTPGFGIFVGLLLAFIFKKINKAGLIAAFSLWNPLLLMPLYWLCYLLGDVLFTPDPAIQFGYELLNQIYHHSGKFLVGNLFIAVPTAITSYYIVLYLISLRSSEKVVKKPAHFFGLAKSMK